MRRRSSRRSQGWGGVHHPWGARWQLCVWLGHVCAGMVLSIHLPQPTVDVGTSLSRCQAQAALAEVQPFPGSQELQPTFLWRQHKTSIVKSPSKYGRWGVFTGTPGGGRPTSCVPSAWASSSLKAALFLAADTFQVVGGSWGLEEPVGVSAYSAADKRFSGGRHGRFRSLARAAHVVGTSVAPGN